MARLLIISNTLPEPDTTAAGVHMVQLLTTFLKAGWEVHYASTSLESAYPANLKGLGVFVHSITINDPAAEAFFKDLKPEVVVFDRYFCEEQFSWQVADAVPEAVRILNTEDLHSLRETRKEAVRQRKEFHYNDWLQSEMAMRELAAIFRSDLVLLTSTSEIDALIKLARVDISYLYYSPITVDILQPSPAYDHRNHIVYMGNGRHQPNIDGLTNLLDTLWPEILKGLPKTELHIYGAYWPEILQKRCKKEKGVIFKGWAQDKNEVFKNARLSLAPMRFGAGLKGKVLDSFSCGCPVIMTAVAADGITGNYLPDVAFNPPGYTRPPRPGEESLEHLIAGDNKVFIEQTVRLYQDKKAWNAAVASGYKAMERFNKVNTEDGLIERILWISEHLASHRAKNVFGTILQQQAYASTRYLSKWIQEKQRNRGSQV